MIFILASFIYLCQTFKECIEPLRNATDTFPLDRKDLHPQQPLNVNQIMTGESRPIKLLRVHNDLGMDDPQGITDDDNEPGMHIVRFKFSHEFLNCAASDLLAELIGLSSPFPKRRH